MAANKENVNKKLTKEERMANRQQKAVEVSEDDVSKGLYGIFPLIQSKEKIDRTLVNVNELNAKLAESTIWVRGRLFVSRSTGKQCFFTIRQRCHTIQALVVTSENVSKQMVKFVAG